MALKRVRRGDKLKGFPADVFNSMLEMLEWYRSGRDRGGAAETRTAAGGDFVLVRNDTGAQRGRGEIIGLGDLTVDLDEEAERETLRGGAAVFAGEEPRRADYFGSFGVLVQALDEGEVGLCRVGGRALVQVDFAHEDQPYADLFDVESEAEPEYQKLQAGEFGAARIIKKESGDGLKWAYVELRGFDPWLPDVHVQLTEDLDVVAFAEGTVLKMQSDGSYLDTERTVEVWGNYLDTDTKFPSGAKLWSRPQRTSGLLEVVQSRGCAERV